MLTGTAEDPPPGPREVPDGVEAFEKGAYMRGRDRLAVHLRRRRGLRDRRRPGR
jgi:hypothetical protein